jgi:anti-sigma factor RsiW
LLDRYVEATLEPARAIAVAAHLRSCRACDALHDRVRIVDALLETTRDVELHSDFTGDLMLRIRAMDVPAVPARPLLPLAAFYLVAAWVVAGVAIWSSWRGGPLRMPAAAQAAQSALAALVQATHALYPAAPIALSVVASVLSIDVLLFAAVVVFYRNVRPRLTAYLMAESR